MGEGIKLPVINGLGRTDRIDNWWAQPFWMGLALTAALVYTAWRLILFPESISYKLEGSTVVSPIFSPNISSGACSDSMNGTTQVGSTQPSWSFGFHSDSVEPATTCDVFTTEPSSNHQPVAGSMSLRLTRESDTVARSACSSSTTFTVTSCTLL